MAKNELTYHDMLVTLASQALSLGDLTGHDVIESLRELGYGHVVTEARMGIAPDRGNQARVWRWVQEVFATDIVKSPGERALRFGEEALELVQAVGITREGCHRLVDYVFDRPKGEPSQEIGGVMVTLYALASVLGLNVSESARKEIERIETPEIRAKVLQRQAEKRKALVGA